MRGSTYLGSFAVALKNTDPAAKWLAAMQSPTTTQNYVNGVNATTVNPMALAAEALPMYLAGVQDAVQSGRMQQRLMATPVSAWKTGATTKGATRLSPGAVAASSKVQAHFQKWSPIYAQISQSVAAMPKGGLANAMARVQAAYVQLKQAAGKSAA